MVRLIVAGLWTFFTILLLVAWLVAGAVGIDATVVFVPSATAGVVMAVLLVRGFRRRIALVSLVAAMVSAVISIAALVGSTTSFDPSYQVFAALSLVIAGLSGWVWYRQSKPGGQHPAKRSSEVPGVFDSN